MSSHTGQTPSNLDTHSNKLQLVVLAQQKKRLSHEDLPFKITHYKHQDELNLPLKTAKQLKYHYFAVEQQLFFCLPDRVSHVSRTVFLSYLSQLNSKKAQFLSWCI